VIESEKGKQVKISRGKSRMPENSVFFEKVVPGMLIGLAIVMVVLIILAAGVIIGIVPFE